MQENISRIYKGSELVYEAPDTKALAAFIYNLVPGDRIELFRAANVRTDAVISSSTLKGVNPALTKGTIVNGPKIGIQDSAWYDINFDSGYDGWCVSDNYRKIGGSGSTSTNTSTPSNFKVGDRVKLFRDANVRSDTVISASTLKGVNKAESVGTITQGPKKVGNINWYYINFDSGHDGWVASDNYVLVTSSSGGGGGGGGTTGGGGGTTSGGGNWDTKACSTSAPNNGKIINVSSGGNVQSAVNSAKPGDTVVVASGTYSSGFTVSKSGTANAWITVKSAQKHGAKLKGQIRINKADYVRIEGFEVIGNGETLLGSTASHHIQFINNHVNGGQVILNLSDFILFEGNEAHGGTGFNLVSILNPQNITGDKTTRNRIIVRNNIFHDNNYGGKTDGSGLIFDNGIERQLAKFDDGNFPALKQSRVPIESYMMGGIIDNNILYRNNGAAIYLYNGHNITVSNNYCYNNLQSGKTGPWAGEIKNINGSNNVFKDNVAVTTKAPMYGIACQNHNDYSSPTFLQSKNITWSGNITYNTQKPGDSAISAAKACPIPASTNKLGQGAQYAKQPTDFLKKPCG